MIKKFEVFTNNISVIYRGIEQLKRKTMKKFGLKGNHAMCLFYLSYHPEGLTASQLCEKIGIDKAAVSRTLSELHKRECISYPNYRGGKKYNTAATLTEKGKKLTGELTDIICMLVDKISLDNITEENRTIMYRSLRTIANNIVKCLNEDCV